MTQIVRKVRIIGTGSYTPERILTNKELEKMVDTNDEWIFNALGIRERHIIDSNQATSDLAAESGMRAIENAGLTPDDIDLIIVATSTPDRLAPSTACIVQDKMKAYNSAAFDVAAVCSGFLFGMSVAAQFIASGVYNNVIVIGADTFSTITDWTSRDCIFFGDGAGAAVMTHTNGNYDGGFLAFRLYSDGRGKYNFTVPAGGSENPASKETLEKGMHYYKMDGKAVFDTATRVLPEAIQQVLRDVGLSIKDIDYMVPHQPSIGILKKTAEIIGLPFEKVQINMEKYANTSGGTIPILLDELKRDGKIHKNNIILFAAVGSGWTWGSAIIKWA